MPTIAHSGPGRVTALWGSALIRGSDGKMRVLQVGDLVQPGDVILTGQNGIVELLGSEDGAVATLRPQRDETSEIDRVIAGLNEGDADVAPAAGAAGGGDGSLTDALRVTRISEVSGGAELLRSTALDPSRVPDNAGTGSGRDAASAPAPAPHPTVSADSSAIDASEEGSATPLGLSAPTGTDASATITVDRVPAIGEVHKADGTLVVAGMTLTSAELTGLVYLPPADYDGSAAVGDFGYTVRDHGMSASGTTEITLAAVNDALRASRALAEQKMSAVTGGLRLPGM